jgi:hypothetical protein
MLVNVKWNSRSEERAAVLLEAILASRVNAKSALADVSNHDILGNGRTQWT